MNEAQQWSTLTFSASSMLQILPRGPDWPDHTAAELNHSAGDLVQSSRGSSSQLAMASGKFSQDFDEFLDAGIEMADTLRHGFNALLSWEIVSWHAPPTEKSHWSIYI